MLRQGFSCPCHAACFRLASLQSSGCPVAVTHSTIGAPGPQISTTGSSLFLCVEILRLRLRSQACSTKALSAKTSVWLCIVFFFSFIYCVCLCVHHSVYVDVRGMLQKSVFSSATPIVIHSPTGNCLCCVQLLIIENTNITIALMSGMQEFFKEYRR